MKFENKSEKRFLIITSVLSLLQGLFYIYDGIVTGFTLNDFVLAGIDLLYIPLVLFWKRQGFVVFICIGSALLVYVNSQMETYLFNNFSALLCLFMAILVYPKIKNYLMIGYLFITALAFALNTEPMHLFLIHAIRSMWLFTIYDFAIYCNYTRKPVILTEDEQQIIAQLCEGKLQKELELNGYSESTIRRRLDSAMKRNDIKSKDELKDLYKKCYSAN